MERVARFADYENEVIETPRRKRGAAEVIYMYDINIRNIRNTRQKHEDQDVHHDNMLGYMYKNKKMIF